MTQPIMQLIMQFPMEVAIQQFHINKVVDITKETYMQHNGDDNTNFNTYFTISNNVITVTCYQLD